MAAMRKGVEKIHKMGAGTSFFIPFYTTKPGVCQDRRGTHMNVEGKT
jgi:hypothetical protein